MADAEPKDDKNRAANDGETSAAGGGLDDIDMFFRNVTKEKIPDAPPAASPKRGSSDNDVINVGKVVGADVLLQALTALPEEHPIRKMLSVQDGHIKVDPPIGTAAMLMLTLAERVGEASADEAIEAGILFAAAVGGELMRRGNDEYLAAYPDKSIPVEGPIPEGAIAALKADILQVHTMIATGSLFSDEDMHTIVQSLKEITNAQVFEGGNPEDMERLRALLEETLNNRNDDDNNQKGGRS